MILRDIAAKTAGGLLETAKTILQVVGFLVLAFLLLFTNDLHVPGVHGYWAYLVLVLGWIAYDQLVKFIWRRPARREGRTRPDAGPPA